MKKILSNLVVAVLCLAVHTSVTAQQVHEDDVNMSLGIKNALIVDIDGANRKTVEKQWKKIIEDYGKTKKNKKANEWVSNQVIIPAIAGADALDVYLKIEENKEMTRAYLWVYSEDHFVNSIDHEGESRGAESLLSQLFVNSRKVVVEKEVEHEEDELKDLEKQHKKLVDKNQDLHEDIKKFREKIAKAEADIEKNLQDQEAKKAEIEKQKEMVSETVSRLNKIGRG